MQLSATVEGTDITDRHATGRRIRDRPLRPEMLI